MLSIVNTVHINVPPDKVWTPMIDVEGWPSFASQFKSIERKEDGPLALGSTARVTPFGFWGAIWTVTEYEAGRSFTWEADMPPGAHLAAGHVIEAEDSGTALELSLTATGPAVTLLSPVLGIIFRRNTRQEGEGLKAHCEGGGA